MDPEWLAMLVSKDYLFPLAWPSYAWLFNLGTVGLLAGAYLLRRRCGLSTIASARWWRGASP